MASYSFILCSFATIGALSIVRLDFAASFRFYQLFLRQSSLNRYLSDPDGRPTWALVTGASDGIGLGIAQELCARDVNVVLHGRDPTKLARVAKELTAMFPKRKIL